MGKRLKQVPYKNDIEIFNTCHFSSRQIQIKPNLDNIIYFAE